MADDVERELRRLDADRPLPAALYQRLETALLDEASDGALLDGLDAPRPIPPATRARLERELTSDVNAGQRRGRALLAVAAAALIVVGSVAVVRSGGSTSNRQVAARSNRSVPAPGVPPLLLAPTTLPTPVQGLDAASAAQSAAKRSTTTTTWDCGLCARNGSTHSAAEGAAAASGAPGGQPGTPAAALPVVVHAQVSAVSPSSGPQVGGTIVTLNGFGFTGANGVRFGAASAANFTVVSDTEIRVMAPASPVAQRVPLSVTYADGSSTPTSDSGPFFTYT